jgi:hypothetical protein
MNAPFPAPKPRLLPSGWWDGIPESFRKSFERKTLREGYLFNLDGRGSGTGSIPSSAVTGMIHPRCPARDQALRRYYDTIAIVHAELLP